MSKECSDCTRWERHVCVDADNKPIERTALLSEQFWYYETCTKNWGLPAAAYLSAKNCKFFVRK